MQWDGNFDREVEQRECQEHGATGDAGCCGDCGSDECADDENDHIHGIGTYAFIHVTASTYFWYSARMESISLWEAIVLGVLQGLTEFLPVSSSGHLVVAQQLFGLDLPAEALSAFDVALHAGTLVAVLVYYWRDVAALLMGKSWKLMAMIAIATLPAICLIPFKDHIELLFTSVTVVGFAWLVTGAVLWSTQYALQAEGPMTRGRAILMGCAQAAALIPGVSRSGSTIAAGMFLGVAPQEAARFSFLMAIPAIGGAFLLKLDHLAAMPSDMLGVTFAGAIAAALVGYIAIRWLLHLIAKGKFQWFGVYCGCAGVLVLASQLF